MVNVVKTTFDISFQYPLSRVFLAQADKCLLTRILCTSVFSEAKRGCIGCCFCYWIQSKGIQCLHCSIIHCWDTQRSFLLFSRFVNIDLSLIHISEPTRLGM